jgi:hypothetical protein
MTAGVRITIQDDIGMLHPVDHQALGIIPTK